MRKGWTKLSEGYTANDRLRVKPKAPAVIDDDNGAEPVLKEEEDTAMDLNCNIKAPSSQYKYYKSTSPAIATGLSAASNDECICLRPLKRIMCCVCGFYMEVSLIHVLQRL